MAQRANLHVQEWVSSQRRKNAACRFQARTRQTHHVLLPARNTPGTTFLFSTSCRANFPTMPCRHQHALQLTRNTSDTPQVKPKRWMKPVKRRDRAAVMVEVRSAPYSSCTQQGSVSAALLRRQGGQEGEAAQQGPVMQQSCGTMQQMRSEAAHKGSHVEDVQQAVLAKAGLVHASRHQPVAPDVHVALACRQEGTSLQLFSQPNATLHIKELQS